MEDKETPVCVDTIGSSQEHHDDLEEMSEKSEQIEQSAAATKPLQTNQELTAMNKTLPKDERAGNGAGSSEQKKSFYDFAKHVSRPTCSSDAQMPPDVLTLQYPLLLLSAQVLNGFLLT